MYYLVFLCEMSLKALLGHKSKALQGYTETVPLGGTVHQYWSAYAASVLPENTCD